MSNYKLYFNECNFILRSSSSRHMVVIVIMFHNTTNDKAHLDLSSMTLGEESCLSANRILSNQMPELVAVVAVIFLSS